MGSTVQIPLWTGPAAIVAVSAVRLLSEPHGEGQWLLLSVALLAVLFGVAALVPSRAQSHMVGAAFLCVAAAGGGRAVLASDVVGAAEATLSVFFATVYLDRRLWKMLVVGVGAIGVVLAAVLYAPTGVPVVLVGATLLCYRELSSAHDTAGALRQVTQSAGEAFFVLSADCSRVTYSTPGFLRLWKGGDSDADWTSSIHPYDRARMAYAFQQAATDGEPLDEEFRVIADDGAERWIWARIFPIRNSDGRIRRNAGLAEDITAKKEAEIQLAVARDQEMSIGARIQRRLLLEEPDVTIPGFDLGALSVPSQRVDGDFYNFFSFDDDTLDLVIGDVMGKGIPAALVGAGAQSTFLKAKVNLLLNSRSSVPQPVEIVREAHHNLVEELIGLENFLTLHYVRLSSKTRVLQFVDCGNTPIILYRSRTDSCVSLKGSNVPLGFLRNEEYQEFSVPLDPGDVLLCYSDGITEAENSSGEPFGDQRLQHFVRAHHELSPVALVEGLTEVLTTYVGGGGFRDDVTAVAVRATGFAAAGRSAVGHFDAKPAALSELRGFLSRELEDPAAGAVFDTARDAMILAAHEVFSTIVEHAGDSELSIPVEITVRGDTAYLGVEYPGDTLSSLYGTTEDSLDAPLFEQLADSVVSSKDQYGTNVVWLSKNLRVPSGLLQ